MVLRFSIEEAKRLKAVLLAAKKRRPTYNQLFIETLYVNNEIVYKDNTPDADFIDQEKLEPSFWFVKDHGMYLMSNGVLAEEDKVIVYAENCNPKKDQDWYQYMDCLNEELGDGSDFIVAVGLNWLDMTLHADPEAEWIEIKVGVDHLALVL